MKVKLKPKKVQKFGKFSAGILIPKTWRIMNNINYGDKLTCIIASNGDLIYRKESEVSTDEPA